MNYRDKKKWDVDMYILDFDRCINLELCERPIRDALTANGNFGVVEYDFDNDYGRLSIFGDNGGDNERLRIIFGILRLLGAYFESAEHMDNSRLVELVEMSEPDFRKWFDEWTTSKNA